MDYILLKRVIRTMVGCGYRESCRKLFVELKILPLISQYIFSLLLFVVNNRNYFIPNSVYHDSNTRHRNDLHLPQATLAMYQKGVCYSGIKVFNGLPRALKDISSKPGKFRIALKKFLQTHSFIVSMSILKNSGNSGVYPAVLHIYQHLLKHNLCETYVHTLYLCIVSLLLIF